MNPKASSSAASSEVQPGPVLVLAPSGRDAELLCETFLSAGLTPVACATPKDFCAAMDERAGCAVIAQEAISDETRDLLLDRLNTQEPWSDFPMIVMVNRGKRTDDLRLRFPRLIGANHVILLQRPLPKDTLLSAVRSALQSRRRQFQVRDHMAQRQALIDALPVLVAQLEPDEQCSFLNRTFAEWFGLDPNRAPGRPFRELVGGDLYERLGPHLRRALTGCAIELEETIAGEPARHVLLRLTPRMGSGNEVAGLYIAAADITSLRKSQEALVESNRLKNLALEGAALGVWAWDIGRNTIEWDARNYRIFEVAENEPVTLERFTALVHPDDRARVSGEIQQALDGRTTGMYSTRYRIALSGGERRWLHAQGGVIFKGKGDQRRAVRMVGTVQDITELVDLDETVRQYRERLELVHSALGIGTWEWGVTAETGWWSPEMYELCGVPTGRTITLKTVLQTVHPEDRPGRLRRLADAVRTAEPGWDEEFRILHPSKGVRWLVSYGRMAFDAAGRPERLFGITLDITEKKAAEEKARDAIATHALSAGLLRGQEEERTRLSQELHDDYVQRLALISMGLDVLKTDGEAPADKIDKLQMYADRLSDDMRELSHQLHPSHLDHLGLMVAVEAECRRIKEYAGIDIIFRGEGCVDQVSNELKLSIYRIVQEALQNVIKHAAAGAAHVTLVCGPESMSLVVEDDGTGFDGDPPSGLGLTTMRERLRPFNGRLHIYSRRGAGTRLEIVIPTSALPSQNSL